MTDLRQLERLPPWVQTLGWVTVSLVVSMLLALGSASYHLTADGDRSGDVYPVKLGPVSLMLHAGDAPSMPPEEAIARADWAPVALPISLGWRSEVLWAHMRLHNTSAMEQSVLLEVAPPRLTHVRVYSQVGDLWEKQASGAAMRSADRPVNMADLVFPFILAPGEQRTVLVETWSRTTSLNLSFVVYPSSIYTGIALRTNILDVVFVGALLVLGLVSLILGISLRELSLFLLSLRIAVVSVWQLFQAGIWSLILPTSVLTTMADNIWWLSGATMSLTAAFSWAFLSHARLWWPVHLFFALMTVVGLGLPTLASLDWLAATAYPPMSTKFSWLLLAGSALISVRLVYCGYLPAVAMLIGSTTAVLVNAPFYLVMLGWSSGTVARFFVSPIPALITSTVLFLGAALHIVNARRLADAALKREQHDAVARLEQQVALRTSELVGARDEAQQANRAKSVFLAKVSHELRTPMHAVLGYVDLVLREPITPSATKKIQAARMAGQQLVGQINDLLDYARMEREQLKLEPTSAALRALAVRLKERTDLLAAERNNQFELALAPDLPPWIWVDVGRLEQVLMVLLSNAVRYTRGGRIRLCIQLASEAWPDSQHENPLTGLSLRFEVEDTGRGIAPEALARIFQAFERGDSLDGDGLGLGLPIAQQLLGLMGSHLEVHSELGSGSRFCFTLQVRQADELPTVPLPQDHLITGYEGRTRQVLVLDDNPANRRYLEELLGDLEFDVRLFSTVSAAITHLKAMVDQAGTSPDVCLVDQRLEGAETGWDFVLALRSAQRTPSSIRDCPVLMLSATEASPPPGWALAHGIDRHLLKPVDQQLLLRTVGELLNLVWTTSAKADFVKPPAGQEEPGAEMSVRQAWKALSDMAESGDLGALDDWMQAHSRLVSVNPQLERLVQAMDFPEIAAYAQGVRRMENSSAGEPAWQGPGVSRYL